MSTIEIERLAISFRNAPCAPGHKHCDVWKAFERLGGRAAILYGMWCATPFRQRWKLQDLGLSIADALDVYAEAARQAGRSQAPTLPR